MINMAVVLNQVNAPRNVFFFAMPEHSWDELIPSDLPLVHAHAVYLTMGLSISLFGVFSLIIKDKLYMSECIVATIVGIAIGPYALKLFNPFETFGESFPATFLELSRVVVGIQCMLAGISNPGNYVWVERKSLLFALGPLMCFMWVVSSLGVKAIFGFDWNLSFLIGACVTPTDPVLANSIVHGSFAEKYIPQNVRLLLSAESAANDGLGLAFVFIPLYLSRFPIAEGIGWWFVKVVLYQVVMSCILGATIGTIALYLLKQSSQRKWIDKESILGFSIALALTVMGSLALLGSDDILACYIAGLALSWDKWFNDEVAESKIQEVIDTLLNFSYFLFFGTAFPWSSLGSGSIPSYQYALFGLWVLFLRRLPFVMLTRSLLPSLKDMRQAFFYGWFGPMGASAIYYVFLLTHALQVPVEPLLPIVFFVVLTSVIVHGASVTFLNYGFLEPERKKMLRRQSSMDREQTLEHFNSLDPLPLQNTLTYVDERPRVVQCSN
ncbi:Sodium/hydrogen exchanger family-domain-containing protein [Gorgonomyces haynaldii]|nr:Sodium/hydrogen exchanger family-domain-containing protein [Gorgonomyces haynaldii]